MQKAKPSRFGRVAFIALLGAVFTVGCSPTDDPGNLADPPKNHGSGTDVAMGNFRRFELLEKLLATNGVDCLSAHVKDNDKFQPIFLNTRMGAYNCYDDGDLQGILMAQLTCFMLEPSLAVAMWYREDRRISRVLCLAYIASLYPVDPMSGDIDPEVEPKDDAELKRRLCSCLSVYRRQAARYEAAERKARNEEIEYVEQHVLELTRQIRTLEEACKTSR